ncbi:LLM class flavin-dependent oxidoreductase [Rhodococcus sp. NPDC058521]|uniref:LLM class flavin-dependent oxidoreductase n=1 Tax=Rhodococcus sp. NPDC058521 TaxID=3346536 RepID=UPI00364B2DBB
MRWGVLTHVATQQSPREAFEDAIRLARAAEDLGFDSFWLAQHRFGAQGGMLPSPLMLLSAIARETDRIRLGTASIATLFEDPRRLLEDAAVLDALSGGRLELGLGSGSAADASRAWGSDHEDRHHRHWNALDAVLDVVRHGIGVERLPVVPATDGLASRIWATCGSAESALAAAERGLGLVVGRRRVGADGPRAEDVRVARLMGDYRRKAEVPRVALSRPVLATQDAKVDLDSLPSTLLAGSPEQVVDGFRDDPGLPLADELLVHTRPIDAPVDLEIASLRLLAEKVRPHLPPTNVTPVQLN